MSEWENAQRLSREGYEFEPTDAGKRFWRHPDTGRLLPEDSAMHLVRQEEERQLVEAGWEPVGSGWERVWRRPDSGYLYPPGAAYEVMRRLEER